MASFIADEMPKIDTVLAEAGIPLTNRKTKALETIRHVLIVDNWTAFFLSEAYARIVALVDEWYQVRYSTAYEASTDFFCSLVVIHHTPFPLHVPLTFSTLGEEMGTAWIGFQASVQKEENPLAWIGQGPNINALQETDREAILAQAVDTSNSIRSINFDLKTIQHEGSEVLRDLAISVLANLQSAAQNLCRWNKGQLLISGWELSQAVEKTLKLFIRRNGDIPKNTHVLAELADHADRLGAEKLDRVSLGEIPSGAKATSLRYGGEYTIQNCLSAYRSALEIIEKLAFAVQIKAEIDIREARFLIKSPWINYDTDSFLHALKSGEAPDE